MPLVLLLILEGFADRRYARDGFLVPRTHQNAVLKRQEDIVAQALGFANDAAVVSEDATTIPLRIDSLCVHGDTPLALESLRGIYDALH